MTTVIFGASIAIVFYIWLLYEAKTAPMEPEYYNAFDIPKTVICPKCGNVNEIKHPIHSFIDDEAVTKCVCGYHAEGRGLNPQEAVEDLLENIEMDAEKEACHG